MADKKVYGYCPTQGKNYSIKVSYIKYSTLEGEKHCRNRKSCEYKNSGNVCTLNCPLYDLAPKEY